MKVGKYKRTYEIRKKISNSLRGNIPWNKGMKKPKKYFDEMRRKRRNNKKYYLNELKNNSIRNKGININKKRRQQIEKIRIEKIKKCGRLNQPKEWSEKEINYLWDNYIEKSQDELAFDLQRSYHSITHKMCRLGITKYHKWTK